MPARITAIIASSLLLAGCQTAQTVAALPLMPVAFLAMYSSARDEGMGPLGTSRPNRPTPDRTALAFVGLSEQDLKTRFGEPTSRSPGARGHTWLFFQGFDCGVVADMEPARDGQFKVKSLETSAASAEACVRNFEKRSPAP